MNESLTTTLRDWIDVDQAQHAVAVSLGIVPKSVFPKAIYWSNNPIGNALYEILQSLTTAGILERRDEPDIQFRWNPNFIGDW